MTTSIKPTVRVRSAPSLEEAVGHLGDLQEALIEIIADRDRIVAEVTAQFGPTIEELDDAVDKQLAAIGAYVSTNAEAVFGKKKSAQLPTGKVALQAGRTVARVDDEEAAIEALRRRRGKVAACLVTKRTLDKRQLAAQTPDIPGVRYATTRSRIQVTPATVGKVISAELTDPSDDS